MNVYDGMRISRVWRIIESSFSAMDRGSPAPLIFPVLLAVQLSLEPVQEMRSLFRFGIVQESLPP